MTGPSRSLRPLVTAVYVAVLLLYTLYLVSSAKVMADMRAPAQSRVMTATAELPQSDFARFWYVGKVLQVQRAAVIGVQARLPEWFGSTFQLDILSVERHPDKVWLYPPPMGLLAMLFAAIPLAASFWVWRAVTLSAACLSLRQAGLAWPAILMGLASTAEIHDVVGGQNGALTAGLLVAALLCIDTRPRLGGALAGLLCIKPQMALIVPFVLFHRGRARAASAAIVTGCAVIALSVIVEGWHSWVWFLTVAQPQSSLILNAPAGQMVRGGFTLLMMARHFGASVAWSWAFQLTSSVCGLALIYRVWRRPDADAVRRMAVTVSLAVLVTPYGFIYDLTGFSVAMAAMFLRASPLARPAFAVLWLAGGYTLSLENMLGIIIMPAAALAAALLVWRDRRDVPAGPVTADAGRAGLRGLSPAGKASFFRLP